jgi:hypothetical protein
VGFIESILPDRQQAAKPPPSSLKEFILTEMRTEKGKPMTFIGRRAIELMVEELDVLIKQGHVELAILKAQQLGLSQLVVAINFYLARLGRSTIYFLPNDRFAKQFDQTRVRQSEKHMPSMHQAAKEGDYQGVRRVALRQYGEAFLYVLGLEETVNALSIPADVLCFDEVDLIPEENMDWARGRLYASDLQIQIYFSQGMNPGLGIDKKYDEGSQRQWVLKCPHCGRDGQVLELEFPQNHESMGNIGFDEAGEPRIECVRCRQPLDREAGRWGAKYPEREKQGLYSWRISQLAMGCMSVKAIWLEWQKAKGKPSRIAKFRCTVLGIADAGALMPITDAVLDSIRQDYRPSISVVGMAGPRTAGLDTGDYCHFVALEWLSNDAARFAWVEEIDGDKATARYLELYQALGCVAGCVDAKPERKTARDIAYANSRVWLCDFKDGAQATDEMDEHEGRRFHYTQIDRELYLDELTDRFAGQPPKFILPRDAGTLGPQWRQLNEHLKALRKQVLKTAKGKDIKYMGGENHLGMATLYAVVAAKLARVGGGIRAVDFRYETAEPGPGAKFKEGAW